MYFVFSGFSHTFTGSIKLPTVKSLSKIRGSVEIMVGKSRNVSLITAFRYGSILRVFEAS